MFKSIQDNIFPPPTQPCVHPNASWDSWSKQLACTQPHSCCHRQYKHQLSSWPHSSDNGSPLTCSFIPSAHYYQQPSQLLYTWSLLRIFYQTTPHFLHTAQLHYMTVYRTRYTNYSVNTFLGSNRDRTVSIFLRSIHSVITLLDTPSRYGLLVLVSRNAETPGGLKYFYTSYHIGVWQYQILEVLINNSLNLALIINSHLQTVSQH